MTKPLDDEARIRIEAARDLLTHVLSGRLDLEVATIGVKELLNRAHGFET